MKICLNCEKTHGDDVYCCDCGRSYLEKYDDNPHGLEEAKKKALHHRLVIYKRNYRFEEKKPKNTSIKNVEKHLMLAVHYFDGDNQEESIRELEAIFGTGTNIGCCGTFDKQFCPTCRNMTLSSTSISIDGAHLPFDFQYCASCKKVQYSDDFVIKFKDFIKNEIKWNSRVDDIREAVVLYFLSKQNIKLKSLYISFGGKEPDNRFFERFQEAKLIKKRSQGLVDIKAKTFLEVETIKWIDSRAAEITMFYGEGNAFFPRGALGENLRVIHEYGKWVVAERIADFHID